MALRDTLIAALDGEITTAAGRTTNETGWGLQIRPAVRGNWSAGFYVRIETSNGDVFTSPTIATVGKPDHAAIHPECQAVINEIITRRRARRG